MSEQETTYENSNEGESKSKKRGPRTKKRDLEKEIDTLKACLAKMAHFSGNQRIIAEHGLELWTPGQKDMHKFKS